jgi:AbrB-like transcriptional regulator
MSNKKNIEPLVGEELLQKVKELGNVSREDKARECGYYTETKNGVERVNMMKFLNALLDADGVQLDSKATGGGRGGRSASGKITVQSNNNLLIGAAYTKKMGLKEGDVFEISLGRKHIHLKQIDSNGNEEE